MIVLGRKKWEEYSKIINAYIVTMKNTFVTNVVMPMFCIMGKGGRHKINS
jgi:hypothetical protein